MYVYIYYIYTQCYVVHSNFGSSHLHQFSRLQLALLQAWLSRLSLRRLPLSLIIIQMTAEHGSK